MKYLLLLLSLSTFTSYGQKNPCRKVKRTIERSKHLTTYKSPEYKYATIIKQAKPNDTFFAILFHFYDNREHFDQYGATVEFTDGTKVTDENVAVKCTAERAVFVAGTSTSSSSSNGSRYVLQAFFRITDENYELFTTKRIASVALHNALQLMPKSDGMQLMKYVECVKNRN